MPKTAAKRIAAKATQPIVLQALLDHGPQTPKQVENFTGLRHTQTHNALKALVAAGRATRRGHVYNATGALAERAMRQANSVWQYARRVEALA